MFTCALLKLFNSTESQIFGFFPGKVQQMYGIIENRSNSYLWFINKSWYGTFLLKFFFKPVNNIYMNNVGSNAHLYTPIRDCPLFFKWGSNIKDFVVPFYVNRHSHMTWEKKEHCGLTKKITKNKKKVFKSRQTFLSHDGSQRDMFHISNKKTFTGTIKLSRN